MAFIRIKMVKGKPYSYLVENYREGGKVRQRVLKYLGAGDLRSQNVSSISTQLGTTTKKKREVKLPKRTNQRLKELEYIQESVKNISPKQRELIEIIREEQIRHGSAVQKRKEINEASRTPEEFRQKGRKYKKIMKNATKRNNQAVIELNKLLVFPQDASNLLI